MIMFSSLLILGCVSQPNEETDNQLNELRETSSQTSVSDSTSLSEEMKKDSTKIVPKTVKSDAKINKQNQRTKHVRSNNSADSKKDVTITRPKTQKKSENTTINQQTATIKTPAPAPPPVVQVPKRKGPRIYFPQKNYNYGKINEGKKINHKFKFINTGDDSLLIKNVDVSCGCTIPKYSNKKIKPGGTGYIDVEYDSKGKFMNQESSIFIYSNSRISPTVELMLLGYVRVPLAKDKKKEEKKDKKEEKKDTIKTTPKKSPEEPKKVPEKTKDPEEPKKPIINTDTLKKKIKDVLPKVLPKTKPTPPKDTTNKADKTGDVKAPEENEDDW